MYCRNCGKQIEDNSKFCESCGAGHANDSQETVGFQNAPPNAPPSASSVSPNLLTVLGYLCYAFAVIDFAGMFFGYDLTGVSWSPIVATATGFILNTLGKRSSNE
jgi:hypothetical protein